MNGVESQALLSKTRLYLRDGERKRDRQITVPRLHFMKFKLANIFLRRYLFLSLELLWNFTALYNQKLVPGCTFRMVEIQLLAVYMTYDSVWVAIDHKGGGK